MEARDPRVWKQDLKIGSVEVGRQGIGVEVVEGGGCRDRIPNYGVHQIASLAPKHLLKRVVDRRCDVVNAPSSLPLLVPSPHLAIP